VPQYRVLVSDNYHYGDPDDPYEHGIFETLAACRTIVETALAELHAPGMPPASCTTATNSLAPTLSS
jgi:hypothetical protein